MTSWSRILERANRSVTRVTGQRVIYHPTSGVPFALLGTFWHSYFEMDQAGVPVQQFQPKLSINLADTPSALALLQGDRVLVGVEFFSVVSVQIDKAYGTADIFLHRGT